MNARGDTGKTQARGEPKKEGEKSEAGITICLWGSHIPMRVQKGRECTCRAYNKTQRRAALRVSASE